MKQPVLLHIKGICQAPDESPDAIELFTCGTMYQKNGHYYLVYDETDPEQQEKSRTTLKIENGGKVSMMRNGTTCTSLMMQRGMRNVGFYNTQGGEFVMGVSASEVDSSLTEQGGKLHFKYELDVNAMLMSVNEVFIDVALASQ